MGVQSSGYGKGFEPLVVLIISFLIIVFVSVSGRLFGKIALLPRVVVFALRRLLTGYSLHK